MGRSYPAAREHRESSSSPVPHVDRPASEESSSAPPGVQARSLDRVDSSAVLGAGASSSTDSRESENDLERDGGLSDPVDEGRFPPDEVDSRGSDVPVLSPTASVESDADSSDPEAVAGSPVDALGSGEPDPAASSEEDPVGSEDGSVDSFDVAAPGAPDPESVSTAAGGYVRPAYTLRRSITTTPRTGPLPRRSAVATRRFSASFPRPLRKAPTMSPPPMRNGARGTCRTSRAWAASTTAPPSR